MKWKIELSSSSLRFIKKEKIKEENVIKHIQRVLRKLKGEPESIDIKKMKGKWRGFY